MKYKKSSLLLALTLVSVFVIGFWVPSPYLIERPGPTVNTLGEIEIDGEIKPVVTIVDNKNGEEFAGSEKLGTPEEETSGQLRLLTVSVVGNPENRLGWLALLPALIDSTQTLVPINAIYQDGVSVAEREAYNSVLMNDSQTNAIAAALREKNITFIENVEVYTVLEDSTAQGLLESGDIFLEVDGIEVVSNNQLRNYIAEQKIGSEIDFKILRNNEQLNVTVTTVSADDGERSVIGVLLKTEYDFPVDVDVALDGIGGPSAGLIFALTIYDLLSDDDLTQGLSISGTGTVDDLGNIGSIGGMQQKIWGAQRAGAELFLFPAGNCKDLPQSLPKDLLTVPVTTVSDAIETIKNYDELNNFSPYLACDEVLARSNE